MFGSELKKLRISRNMSQNDLSKSTGIPQTSISDLERDRYIPKVNVCLKLAKALDVDADILFKTLEDNNKAS